MAISTYIVKVLSLDTLILSPLSSTPKNHPHQQSFSTGGYLGISCCTCTCRDNESAGPDNSGPADSGGDPMAFVHSIEKRKIKNRTREMEREGLVEDWDQGDGERRAGGRLGPGRWRETGWWKTRAESSCWRNAYTYNTPIYWTYPSITLVCVYEPQRELERAPPPSAGARESSSPFLQEPERAGESSSPFCRSLRELLPLLQEEGAS